MENILPKAKASVSLNKIRDRLISGAQKIDALSEEDLQVYSNGVLDIYNDFVRIINEDERQARIIKWLLRQSLGTILQEPGDNRFPRSLYRGCSKIKTIVRKEIGYRCSKLNSRLISG